MFGGIIDSSDDCSAFFKLILLTELLSIVLCCVSFLSNFEFEEELLERLVPLEDDGIHPVDLLQIAFILIVEELFF